MKAMETNVGQKLGIEHKVPENGSLCYVLLSLRDYTECFFSFFPFEMWNMRRRNRTCVVIDGRIRTWLCSFDIYFCPYR